ncbi:MetQ/NlpA family ABC transporter substrate-binding protein [Corynebacterium aquatimens]|uniref:D-methionine transport system substrate-binding protein n=1 Tax=Corynebacterium aquatimens TaxID=1190508 RepID=A0A931E4S5_9CORY|nr:MetQ/NlpA family ABC transporter substrate-binding protein [Corynebacterium aquatimens]MBG6123086.1 D-methionine transport system substrate-binding protein [Corynebacterium aquatimens]WJY66580.1 D-methionine-binding lipoprotein MetQ precursor [Corynebacterium aquatimens]
MRIKKIVAATAASALALAGLAACSDSTEAGKGTDDNKVVIGTTDADQDAWKVFEEEVKKEGIDLEVKKFTEYTPVNPALSEKQIDISKFQTIDYQAKYNVSAGKDTKIIGSGEINTLGLFWKDHDSLDGIEGQEIAIPNDDSNQGRAINVLVQAGLVKVKDGASKLTPTPNDIVKDESKVKVVAVDASQTPAAYNEGRPAVINNNWLERANIDAKSAVYADDPNSELAEPYINVFSVRAEDIDNPTYEKLVEIWQSDAVTEALEKQTKGTAVQVKKDKTELNKILERLQNESK